MELGELALKVQQLLVTEGATATVELRVVDVVTKEIYPGQVVGVGLDKISRSVIIVGEA